MARTVNVPSLNWHEKTARLLSSRTKKHIKTLKQSNVVLHSSLSRHSRSVISARYFSRSTPVVTPSSQSLRLASSRGTPNSPFAHHKIRTSMGATILMFNSGQIIRSGGDSIGVAVISLLKFVNYLRLAHPHTHAHVWIGAATVPNSVFSGQFANMIEGSLKLDSCATFTSKFPGIAIALPTPDKITPEVFLRRSKFIIPGIKSPESIAECTNWLVSAVQPHFSSDMVDADI